jgi:methyl-accepting chemotaxis protein-1 (serine sensor receptor)
MKHWLSQAPLSWKFTLLAVLATLLLVPPCALVLQRSAQQWQLAQRQHHGLQPAAEVLQLVQQMQHHRGQAAAWLGGDADAQAALEGEAQEVAQAFAALASHADATLGDGWSRRVRRLQGLWNDLGEDVRMRRIEGRVSVERHIDLIWEASELLARVAYHRDLGLQSSNAVHLLAEIALSGVPQAAETLGQMRVRGIVALAEGNTARQRSDERARVELLLSQFRQQQQHVVGALARLDRDGGADRGGLGKRAAELFATVDSSLALVDEQVIRRDAAALPVQAYAASLQLALDALYSLADEAFGVLRQRALAEQNSAAAVFWTEAAVLALGVPLVVLVALVVLRGTAQSAGTALRLAESVAAGDLTSRVGATGRDELSRMLQALAYMCARLRHILGNARNHAETVNTAAHEIRRGSADLSHRTEEQAAAIQETVAALEQLVTSALRNGERADRASARSREAAELASQCEASFKELSESMQRLDAESSLIGGIADIIDGVAHQTRLLALNASVEAARAGEHGNAFGVVALEVRTLAARAAAQATGIRQRIQRSQAATAQGRHLADGAARSVQSVAAAIGEVSTLVSEMRGAMQEQNDAMQQVGSAMGQIDAATQGNAALAEQSAAAAETLLAQAQALQSEMAVFRIQPAVRSDAAPAGG